MKHRFTQDRIATFAWLMVLFMLPSGSARGGVYDSAAAWWHFDYAPNYTPGSANVANTNEIRDQRDWGTAAVKGASGKHATAVYGPIGGPEWTNCPVVCPAGGQKYGDYSMWFHPLTNGIGQVYPDAFQVANFCLPNSATILTRFLWNGFTFSSSYPGWIYNNALDWNGKKGWMFGMTSGPRLSLLIGQTTLSLDTYTVVTGKWYDAAAVLTDNGTNDTVEFYIWPQDGTLLYKKYSTNVVLTASGSSIIGGEPAATSYGYATNSNNGKTFAGVLNHLAVWNRALSYEEVLEAFCYPQPLIQIGLNNNGNTDLRAEAEVDAEYNLGDPWHTMRRAVTSSTREATIKVPLSSIQAGLGYLFHVNTLTPANTYANLSLIVNTVTNATQQATSGSTDLYWQVARNQLITGTNSFTLRYEGGTAAYTSFDWMELGGSWQIGTNNNNAGEFIVESSAGDHFYITDPNWKHLERAVVQGSDTNTVLHFVLSPEMVTNHFFTYTTRVVQQGNNPNTAPTPPFPFSIGVNDRIMVQSTGVPDNTLVNIPFERGDLRAGENTVNLMFNSTNGWLQFDFHRLEVAPWPSGMLFFLR